LQWVTSSNHFLARFRTGGSNFDLQWDLNDNSGVTGLSAGNWSSTNRGNVNGDGFCLLTLTYDASQTSGANAFKLYWNGSLMSTTTGSTSNSRSTSAVNSMVIGNNGHNYTTSAGAFDGGVDEFKIFTSLLSAANVTSLYNSGSPANAANSFSTGLLTEITFDSNVNDSAGSFPTTTNNTGTRTAY
jgi:hypothetical protein